MKLKWYHFLTKSVFNFGIECTDVTRGIKYKQGTPKLINVNYLDKLCTAKYLPSSYIILIWFDFMCPIFYSYINGPTWYPGTLLQNWPKFRFNKLCSDGTVLCADWQKIVNKLLLFFFHFYNLYHITCDLIFKILWVASVNLRHNVTWAYTLIPT